MQWYHVIMTSNCRDLPSLVQGLGTVLNDPNKMVLFHYVCQLLPEEAQAEFDRIAAVHLTEGIVCAYCIEEWCVCV